MKRLEVAPPYCLVKARHGLMLANANDIYMGAAIITYGECCQLELEMLLAFAENPGLVVEVGANMGIFTVPLAQWLEKKARRIVAFEPQPVIFQQLCANLALNGLMNVTAWPYTCGQEPGSVTFERRDYAKIGNFGAASMSNSALESEDSAVKALCVTLDEMLPNEHVGLIKIDVEGSELKVLKGSRALIERSRPLLYVEDDRVEHSQELIEWLWVAGYDLWWHTPPLFNPDNFYRVWENHYERILSFNLVGVPRGVDFEIPDPLIKVEDSTTHPLRPSPPLARS